MPADGVAEAWGDDVIGEDSESMGKNYQADGNCCRAPWSSDGRRSNLCTGYSCLKTVRHGTAQTVAAADRDRVWPVREVGESRSLAGRALRGACLFEAARLCRSRGPDAGAGHWRHHRDLQRRLRCVVEASAFSRARAAGEPATDRAARGRYESRPWHISDVSREPPGI